MPRPRTACNACAAIKSACSKSQPCGRCDRLSLCCSYEGPLPSRELPQSICSRVLKRVRHNKSSRGCKTCITRRKKCDELLPVCGECQRLGLPCSPRLSSQSNPQTRVGRLDEPTSITGDQKTGDQNDRDHDQPYVGDTVSLHADSASITNEYLAWVALLDENYDSNITRLGHLNNSSALANTRVSNRSPNFVHSNAALRHFSIDNTLISQWHPTERHLLHHFLQIVSRALVVVNDDANPFLLKILPMAMTNTAVKHALLALTARQLCRVYPAFEDTLVHQQSLALHHLKRELLETVNSENALAATLLMCLFETFQGTSRKWIFHLYGAKALIDSRRGDDTSQFLVSLYQHIYRMASLNSERILLLTEEPKTPISNFNQEPVIHPILGMAEDLYRCLGSISQLANQRTRRSESVDSDAAFLLQANTLKTYLQTWTPREFSNKNFDEREGASAAEAVRWGCIIWLLHITDGYSATPDTRQEALDEILSAVSCIRPGSPFETQLLFPLFMAGVSASLKSERLRIEYRLNILEGITGMGNIARVHQLLDAVWKDMNEGCDVTDWEAMFRNEYGGIVLI